MAVPSRRTGSSSVPVELRGVSKRYSARPGDRPALEPTDALFPAGATSVLIGPSGCGKSTLLRLVNGLVQPDTGEILVGEQRVDAATLPALRLRMGYLIQEGGLFPHLTAAANATLMARHLGWERSRTEARLAELARLTHLPEDALARHPSELSGGQRQRVALIRALLLDPDVLLLDEPLGALDPMIRSDLQRDLRTIFRSLAKTVVLVTHDLAEAAWFADVVFLMRAGRIVQRGSLEELVASPADDFVERFLDAQRSFEVGR